MEEWVDIPGYEGLYQITRDGKIRNVTNGNKLLGNVNSHGYVVVSLTKNGRKKDCKVHRLLALTFCQIRTTMTASTTRTATNLTTACKTWSGARRDTITGTRGKFLA